MIHVHRYRVFLTLVATLNLAACASSPDPHIPIGPEWAEPNANLQVMFVPPPEQFYVEVANSDTRYAGFELNSGMLFAASALGGGIGIWGASAHAAAGTMASPAALINPYVAAFSILVGPAVTAVAEARRQGQARARAKPFVELYPQESNHLQFTRSFEEAMALEQYLGFDSYTLRRLDTAKDAQDRTLKKNRDVADGKVLIVALVTKFTPRFEILEVELSYAVVEKTTDGKKSALEPTYQNTITVQSKQRSALDGSDRREELAELMDAQLESDLKRIRETPRISDFEKRRKIGYKMRKYKNVRKRAVGRYEPFDKTDPEGSVWLADGGAQVKAQVALCMEEAARLLMADLTKGSKMSETLAAVPAGAKAEMEQIPVLDTADRIVYRMESGRLLSLDRKSRYIHLANSK